MFLLAKQGDFLFETQWKVEYSEIFHDVEIIKNTPHETMRGFGQ